MRTKTAERRVQIVDALAVVMARKGYDGATIGDIGLQAGLAPGLVHYHFKSKQEVLLALLDQLRERHAARVNAALAEAGASALERLDAFIDAHLSLGQHADPVALSCWILLSGEALRQGEVLPRFAAVLAESVEACRSILANLPCQGEMAAPAIVAAIQGYLLLGSTARAVVPKGSAADAVKLMARGLLS
jgi:TetR/AcrR family transcriptional repressor of bet genes